MHNKTKTKLRNLQFYVIHVLENFAKKNWQNQQNQNQNSIKLILLFYPDQFIFQMNSKQNYYDFYTHATCMKHIE